MTKEPAMAPHPKPSIGSSRRAVRMRSRIVFFLLRRALRRMGVRASRPAGGRGSIDTLVAQNS
jgi:hypothetical protein